MALNPVLLWTFVAAVAPLPPPGEWIPLFDGRSLSGWTVHGGTAPYVVEDGAIVGRMVVETQNTFLASEGTFRDFVLELEFKPDAGINSGVQFRSHSGADHREGRVHGYQYEIDATPRALTAGLYEERGRKWLVPREDPAEREAWKPKGSRLRIGEWNQLRVECVGHRVRTWLNGEPMVDYEDPAHTTAGFIALQVHQTRDAALVGKAVRWRNLRVRALP